MKALSLLLITVASLAQSQTPPAQTQAIIGTVSAFKPEALEIEVKPDNAAAVALKIGTSTLLQRITPGQNDLSKAQAIQITDVSLGDRVLVTLGTGGAEVRRIVVVSAGDISKYNAAERLDWAKRGVAGVVTALAGNDITVESRSLGGAAKFTVTAAQKTSFKRYPPDSVKFSDAKPSSLGEVSVGDQLRARGLKSADGMHVDAEEVVFGTFLSKAGTITAVNSESHELTMKDLSNNKPLTIKFITDSQIKRMPDMAAMGRGAPGAAASNAARGNAPAASAPTGAAPPPNAAAVGRGPGAPGGAARPTDIGALLDSLPLLKLDDLKPGEIIVVSAIKGAKPDQITAVTFLANAEALVQLAMAARGAGYNGPAPSLSGLASSIGGVGP